jgi:hypothetical protein
MYLLIHDSRTPPATISGNAELADMAMSSGGSTAPGWPWPGCTTS